MLYTLSTLELSCRSSPMFPYLYTRGMSQTCHRHATGIAQTLLFCCVLTTGIPKSSSNTYRLAISMEICGTASAIGSVLTNITPSVVPHKSSLTTQDVKWIITAVRSLVITCPMTKVFAVECHSLWRPRNSSCHGECALRFSRMKLKKKKKDKDAQHHDPDHYIDVHAILHGLHCRRNL